MSDNDIGEEAGQWQMGGRFIVEEREVQCESEIG
jgi:hypothetical protein